MTVSPNQLSVAEFALRVIARPTNGSILVLVSPTELVERVALRLRSELKMQAGISLEHVDEPHNAIELIAAIRRANTEAVVLVSGLESFEPREWQRLDLLRSRLLRGGATMFVMSQDVIENLSQNAPNLASWIGGSIWNVDMLSELLTKEERETRLLTLRQWSGLSDAEVLRLAASSSLPKEPEYMEWVVLLKRPDLIGNA